MHSSTPLLSIIITCFNYELYIRECIDSALRQTYRRKEVIVVDDGSTDRSWARIREYGDRIVSKRTENRGALLCSLTGLSLARGDFVYFLDADDLLLPSAIAELAPYLRSDVSKIQFMLLPIDKNGLVIGEAFPRLTASEQSQPLIQSINRRGFYNTPPTSGNVYRRDVYENLGDLSYERAIDGVPYLLAPFVGNVVSIEKPLGKYRIHNANLSSFSTLTTERMKGYSDRFMGRLRHLSKLIEARGIKASVKIRPDYAYVLEMTMFGVVASGSRPDRKLVTRYLKSAYRENRSFLRRGASFALAAGLLLLPDAGRRQLAGFRLDPSRFHSVRRRLKHVLSSD